MTKGQPIADLIALDGPEAFMARTPILAGTDGFVLTPRPQQIRAPRRRHREDRRHPAAAEPQGLSAGGLGHPFGGRGPASARVTTSVPIKK